MSALHCTRFWSERTAKRASADIEQQSEDRYRGYRRASDYHRCQYWRWARNFDAKNWVVDYLCSLREADADDGYRACSPARLLKAFLSAYRVLDQEACECGCPEGVH